MLSFIDEKWLRDFFGAANNQQFFNHTF